jgi:hypothetical protein
MNPVLSRRSLLFGAGSTVVGWLGWLLGGKSAPGQEAADSAGALAGPPAPPAWLGRPWAGESHVTYAYYGPEALEPGPDTTVTTYVYDPDRGTYFSETGSERPPTGRGRS